MPHNRTPRPPSAGPDASRTSESPETGAGPPWALDDPFYILLDCLTDTQFNAILSRIPETASHLPFDERFLAAARLTYPRLSPHSLSLGPYLRRPRSVDPGWWKSMPREQREEAAFLEHANRILRVAQTVPPKARAA